MSIYCGAISSQSSRIQGVAHQHAAFAERNEGIRDLEHTYTELAENEEWMAVRIDKTIQRRKDYDNRAALAEEEEQILKCLGAAALLASRSLSSTQPNGARLGFDEWEGNRPRSTLPPVPVLARILHPLAACGQGADTSAVHSITSSARASSIGGTSRLSALAVCKLMTNSNLVDCTTGRCAGFAPLRI
jgi:hypothetical protein